MTPAPYLEPCKKLAGSAIVPEKRRPRHRPAASIDRLIEIVAKRRLVSVSALVGRARARIYARPRQFLYWLAAEAGHTTTDIGVAIGGRDHTTVMYGIRRHKERMNSDAAIAAEGTALLDRLRVEAKAA